MDSLKEFNFVAQEKFSAKKLFKFLKVAKPAMKLWKKKRTNAVSPSSCTYDVVESVQNDMNESELLHLNFKFLDHLDDEVGDNLKNEELERRLQLDSENVLPSETEHRLPWASPPGWDVCRRGGSFITTHQSAESQIPISAA